MKEKFNGENAELEDKKGDLSAETKITRRKFLKMGIAGALSAALG